MRALSPVGRALGALFTATIRLSDGSLEQTTADTGVRPRGGGR